MSGTNDWTGQTRLEMIAAWRFETGFVCPLEESIEFKREVVVDSNPENRDPITKEPGSHPVGTGIGSAGDAATVAAVDGPVEAILGGAIGVVVGDVVFKYIPEAAIKWVAGTAFIAVGLWVLVKG